VEEASGRHSERRVSPLGHVATLHEDTDSTLIRLCILIPLSLFAHGLRSMGHFCHPGKRSLDDNH
jgi:hypothetical protein